MNPVEKTLLGSLETSPLIAIFRGCPMAHAVAVAGAALEADYG